MKRLELEHLIRAAGAIAGSDQIVVLGSQAILGSWISAPAQLLVSQEADVFPLDNPEKADLIDGSIGEMSPFHEQFGYYAHGVGPETATLPPGWHDRLVRVRTENTRGVTGLCLHPLDLAISKLAAGRPKDMDFVKVLIEQKIVALPQLHPLISSLDPQVSQLISDRMKAIA
ncbi:MAG: hypothetical protein A2268_00550 [Candidatus Raymondbacteria bacterium RifOxyA12_full_50_37]|uniref:DUF6036 domain-containing protein n=1 Tax=Candidatus Raymondbacteria bacterium RIFOXYD12_FULL_49_13 TaxID=1817890 RepID=A0A1F7F371_UNCRA|nr:MAG: hypothetical protein A2350_09035 [Candidatus Raymondbacteria bacterium RifOxyB12_full_50_8]OGJ91473.1 MAG: hypothetical protein A2268_00550 [Candidatus Raymondbacteria bacterium RifOxyA12_full_50_37]OGJ92803.1 MAG: hypothetical protein A2248_04600 [Candidatus Raymondbacteria bacterium RIFOXYA2_FULL_49_16]OGK01003.1 MAG: hypothetical protein A2519_17265 [Candidatus Raymondbacteria bacterium RIFOXYD12_FULL_49_13]OGK03557.1 MAG: hypothetical protein A2487_06745 [Candidatus Raymondbacteria 